jgi:hypothetical protein
MDALNLVTEILNHVFADVGKDRLEITQIDLDHRKEGDEEHVTAMGIFSKSGMLAGFTIEFLRERTIFDIVSESPWWQGGKLLRVGFSHRETPCTLHHIEIGSAGPDFSYYSNWLKAVIKRDEERRGVKRP